MKVCFISISFPPSIAAILVIFLMMVIFFNFVRFISPTAKEETEEE